VFTFVVHTVHGSSNSSIFILLHLNLIVFFEAFGSVRSDTLHESKNTPKASQLAVRHITDGQVASMSKESLSERMKRLNDKFGTCGKPEERCASTIPAQSIVRVHACAQGNPSENLERASEFSSKCIDFGGLKTSNENDQFSQQQEHARNGNEETTDDEPESIDCNSPILGANERQADPVSLIAGDEKSQESPILWINTGKPRNTGITF
jgi:hypothetical protein